MKTTIYIATHKKFNYKKMNEYKPIQVGAAIAKEKLDYLGDDTGINISSKNKNYCELTAFYWIWKNDKSDVVGLCHYRRYLSLTDLTNNSLFFLRKGQIAKYLKEYDIILPTRNKTAADSSIKKQYCSTGVGKEKDLDNTRDIISKKYPDYLQAYDKVMNGTSASFCNMMICSKKNFDEYCSWLFDILFELESITDLSNYNPAEARIFGYISERLLNVWVEHNNLKVKYCTMINTEEKKDSIFKKAIRKITRGLKK